ncbi:L-ascorbate metabolism protein UlaG (beta-lactamase superfamily) [Actinomycetospora succinea]|uniref:L-ascorbate metabolism protein UlaG (Beta-lactamase superfamily) n=1 Tax=Actinomycetospora succinea TaxID=663603 RepID=A0A4R6VE91_9PSEU|nr:MBL fold metallo-hydrolase [Actinomycetospora succinea]TDQ58808.1 L-ascorbate metabolism protein UlaG (beta-lactamase superfamily) [Actinomycetospora succinea]
MARGALLLPVALAGAALATHVRRNMGASRAELRRAAARSPHASGGTFANREPGLPRPDLTVRQLATMVLGRTPRGRPGGPIPLVTSGSHDGRAELAVTWFGHASVLLEVDGRRVLVDPVWSERTSPVPRSGPRRLHPAPVPLAALGEVDVVLLSHDHYDHLDRPTITALARDTAAVFVAPVGVGAHLRAWGVALHRIVEGDWDDVLEVAGLTLTCLECRHFSGRTFRRNTTQWAAWKVAGPAHAVYVAGDTGPSEAHARTGAAHGPFDLTLMPVGAYADLWPDIHTTPEQAVAAHLDVKGGVMLPIHWATFVLGFHPWDEPAERTLRAAEEHDVPLVLPTPGGRVDLSITDRATSPWWRGIGTPVS